MRDRPRRIIICCDGTACTSYRDNEECTLTNVSRISRAIKPATEKGTPQMVYYQPGVGTDAANPRNKLNQGLGIGIDDKIMEAYSFICHNYSGKNDQIILIGFSRGAFTVRCVADLVTKAGLLTKMGLYYLVQLYKLWADGKFRGPDVSNLPPVFRNEIVKLLRRNIRIQVCAVWDTVCSLGMPWFGLHHPRPPSRLNFIHSDWPESIENAFQALSLHEHRQTFLAIVLRPEETNDGRNVGRLRQCWFMGYHSDIGGGSKDECLAQFALAWMIIRLAKWIEFDSKCFWMPSPVNCSWKLGPAPEGAVVTAVAVRAIIRDPMNFFFWLWGSRHRKPRRQFWSEDKFIEVEPSPDNVSEEFMHTTVRLLAELKAFRGCRSLKGINPMQVPSDGGSRWVWNLRSCQSNWRFWKLRSPPVHTYSIEEDPMHRGEKALLKEWIWSELRALQRRARENDQDPETLIASLLQWLQKRI